MNFGASVELLLDIHDWLAQAAVAWLGCLSRLDVLYVLSERLIDILAYDFGRLPGIVELLGGSLSK